MVKYSMTKKSLNFVIFVLLFLLVLTIFFNNNYLSK